MAHPRRANERSLRKKCPSGRQFFANPSSAKESVPTKHAATKAACANRARSEAEDPRVATHPDSAARQSLVLHRGMSEKQRDPATSGVLTVCASVVRGPIMRHAAHRADELRRRLAC